MSVEGASKANAENRLAATRISFGGSRTTDIMLRFL